MKIVINKCHGGFGLSEKALLQYAELKGLKVWIETDKKYSILKHYWTSPPEQRPTDIEDDWFDLSLEERAAYNKKISEAQIYDREIPRDDIHLVQVVEELGPEADGRYAALKIVEIPDNVKWEIDEYDGLEWVAETHRTWR